MTDNEYTKEQIIEIFERCTGGGACARCPMKAECDEDIYFIDRHVLDIIKHQNAEIDGLIYKFECLLCHATGGKLSKHTYDLRTMEIAVTDYINENHDEENAETHGMSFYFELEKCIKNSEQFMKEHNAEVIKEFAERLKAGLIEGGIYPVLVKNQIEKVVKDMTGEAYTLDRRSQDVNFESLRHLSESEHNVYLMGEWEKDGND